MILAGYRKDIPEIIGACDVFAFPSFHEGLPVSLMEAMAGNLPVVCSAIRGNVDLVRDGLNGFLLDPMDINGWKDRLQKLLRDENLCDEFAGKALTVITNYSNRVVVDELIAIYGRTNGKG